MLRRWHPLHRSEAASDAESIGLSATNTGYAHTDISLLDNGTKSEKQKRKQRTLTDAQQGWTWLVTDSWSLECLGMLIAISSLLSIVAVLLRFNKHPITDWHYVINPNAVLSILGTVLKGSMLVAVCACLGQLKWSWYNGDSQSLRDFQTFDAASRGPFGAIGLLWTLKFIHIGSLGAFVTILALLSDTFIQQSLKFPVKQLNSTASVPMAQEYISTRAKFEVVPQLVTSIYNGILDKDITRSSSAIRPVCTTGNCTYPDYATLGVCSKCEDISQYLRFHDLTPPNSHLGGTYYWTLPNGFNSSSVLTAFTDLAINATGTLTTDTLLHYEPRLVNITAIWGDSQVAIGTVGDTLHAAFDCVLYYCVQRITSMVNQTVLNEFATTMNHYPSTLRINDTDLDSDIIIRAKQEELPLDTDPIFTVNGKANELLSRLLSSRFTAQGGVDVTGNPNWGGDLLEGVFLQGNQSYFTTIDNLATSLTNAMRTVGEARIADIATQDVTFIHVRWLWLLLPLAMLMLAAVLLLATIWQNRQLQVPAFRNSALAIMDHGIRRGGDLVDNKRTARPIETLHELELWADGITAKLLPTGRSDGDIGLVNDARQTCSRCASSLGHS